MSETADQTMQSPPAPPRPITPAGRKRSWVEPSVKTWWMLAALVLFVGITISIDQYIETNHDRRLVSSGTLVWAKIVEAGGQTRQGYVPQEPGSRFKLETHLPDGQVFKETQDVALQGESVITYAKPQPDAEPAELLAVGRWLQIHVNPSNPHDFTVRGNISMIHELGLGLSLLPLGLILLAIALLKRWSVLRTWKAGEAAVAVALETRHSAIAPLSRIVRFTLRDSRDSRIFNTTAPARLTRFESGEEFWVVHPPRRPDKSLFAAAYR